MPSCTVTVRSAGTPSPTSIRRIASDAAMKQSTCRCFHRENELPLQMKVDAARRDERRRPPAPVRCRATAPATPSPTPCGSCAWMTSGLSRLMTRDSRQAAARSISVRGASGIRSSPSLGAPPQLAVRVRDERRALADRAQAVDGQQDLVLAAAPGPRGVDVEGEHQSAASPVPRRRRVVGSRRVGTRCCSSQSFANFRNT